MTHATITRKSKNCSKPEFFDKKNRVFNKKSCKLKTVHFNYDKHILSFMVMIFYNEIHNHITIWTLNGKK